MANGLSTKVSRPTLTKDINNIVFIIAVHDNRGCVRRKERWLASPLTGTGTAFGLTCYHTSG